jgi:hypothetical protein
MNKIIVIIISFFSIIAETKAQAITKDILLKNHLGKEVNGSRYEYHENGRLVRFEESYPFNCNGKIEKIFAKSESYFENGNIQQKGYLAGDGTKRLIRENYNENGVLVSKDIFDDFCEWSWKEIEFENGKPIKTTTLIKGIVKNVQVGGKDYKPKVIVLNNENKNPNINKKKQIEVDDRDNGNKYCFDDSYNSGNKFELNLIDGGKAKIIIKNTSGEIIRTGSGTWSGTNDGVGGDFPKITLRLSTGTLRFSAVVDQYQNRITMLIDSRNNQWLMCF